MKRRNVAAAAVAAVLLSGCYHAVIDTGRPANGTTITRPWAHSFIVGIVPPSVTETAQKCPGGIAKVETQQTFLNGLVGALTYGIYTPMTITVSCTGRAADAGAPTIKVEAGKVSDAVQKAYELSKSNDAPVFLQF
jgi:hypothetical protein